MNNIKKNIIFNDESFTKIKELSELLNKKSEFIDHNFPPNIQSLIFGTENYNGQWDLIKFHRIDSKMQEKQDILQNFHPDFIQHGKINPLNFLNVISILVHKKEFILRLFEVNFINDQVYAVWIFIGGQWKLMQIDPLFPQVGQQRKDFIFSYSKSPGLLDLWINVVEKAFAKALGSYYKLLFQNSIFTIQNLTGLPFEKLHIFNLKELWPKLKEYLNKNHLIMCSFKDNDSVDRLYLISQYYEEPLLKLVQIKIGYWNFTWDGDYSFNSSKWTQEQRDKINYNFNDPYTIWMTIDDFQKNFDQVISFKNYPNYYYNHHIVHKKEGLNQVVLKTIVHQDSHVFLTLFQQDARKFDNSYRYSYFRISILQLIDGKAKYVLQIFSQKRNIEIEKMISQGSYVILVESNWSNIAQDYTLGTYSSSMVWIDEISMSQQQCNRLELLFWKSFAKEYPDQMIEKCKTEIVQQQFVIKEYYDESLGIHFYLLNNLSSENTINQQYEIYMQGYNTPNDKSKVVIEPGESEIILFKEDINYETKNLEIKLMKEGLLMSHQHIDDELYSQLLKTQVNCQKQVLSETQPAKLLTQIQEQHGNLQTQKKNRFWIFQFINNEQNFEKTFISCRIQVILKSESTSYL